MISSGCEMVMFSPLENARKMCASCESACASRMPKLCSTTTSPSCSSSSAPASAPVPFITRSSAYSPNVCKSSWLEKIAVKFLMSSSIRSELANAAISSLNDCALWPNSSFVSMGTLQCAGSQSPILPFSEMVIMEPLTSCIFSVNTVSLLLTVTPVRTMLTKPTRTPAMAQEARNKLLKAMVRGTPSSSMKNGKTIPMTRPNPIIRVASRKNVFGKRRMGPPVLLNNESVLSLAFTIFYH